MARNHRTLAIGAAFIFFIAGCESGGRRDGETPPNGIQFAPLAQLEAISVSGDPLADISDPVKILSELQYGQNRLIAYVNNDSCGILAASKGDPKVNQIHLVSKWPANGQGSNGYPAGPYNSASGPGNQRVWASLLCSKNAMVIEYASGEGAPEQARGQVTVTQAANIPATSRITIGDSQTRKQIENWVKASGKPADTDTRVHLQTDLAQSRSDASVTAAS
ncbi:hypothetical protein [Streptomyces sp. NRRL F-2580]|uniref:hypothetical protein n=1 Tax=Streptomyces sp. NRRL F-2580 TaxID=1463841 RepID=UPI00131E485B|nr:hypothetical protein [Streptomyces sp. NRRL F-2580]